MKRGGSTMSPELRTEIENDPEYRVCMLKNYHTCEGRITREHALYYANKKIQQKFAIIALCAAGHGVDLFQDSSTELPKDMRAWVALSRATDEEIQSISKAVNYFRERDRLNQKYGEYQAPEIPADVLQTPMEAPKLRDARKKVTVDEAEREARAYARQNGCTLLEAREVITNLV